MSLNINQFAMSPIQGVLDLLSNGQTISCQIDVTSAGGLVSGQSVKLIDSAGGIPKVVECSTDADDIFGFIEFDHKHKSYSAGNPANISAFEGNVMVMTASAAISRGALLEVVLASTKVATAATGKRVIGSALDKALADGDLIRVFIKLNGPLAP